MEITDAIVAINEAANRHAAQAIANGVAAEAQAGLRPSDDERAVRQAWHERWGSEATVVGYTGPRAGTNWTGD